MKRSGMATILAIVSIGLVTTALAVMTVAFAGQRRITATNRVDSQLRQLLLAGAADAVAHAQKWGDTAQAQKWSVSLPAELQQQGATLSVEISAAKDQSAIAKIIAAISGHQRQQQLKFQQADSHWKLVDATLGS